MVKIAITFFVVILINISLAKANDYELFSLDEGYIESQFSSVSIIESKLINGETLVNNERASLENVLPNGQSAPIESDVKFASCMAGFCCFIGGAAIASLYYYYKTGDIAVGRESLKNGLIGSGVFLALYIGVYIYALSSSLYGI